VSKKKLNEIKNYTVPELENKIRETEAQFFKAKMQHEMSQLENTASLWLMRKNLARMKTMLTQQRAKA
jgi:large subunit ribosomal protein L29